MAARLSVAVLPLFFLLLSSCLVITSEKNRPGQIDVVEPPPQMDEPERVVPADPGGWFVTASIAPFLELGATFNRDDRRRTLQLGGEFTLGGASTDDASAAMRSRGELLESPLLFAVSWTPYSTQSQIEHRLAAELGFRSIGEEGFVRISGGWTTLLGTGHHGPQLTIGALEYTYLRWNWDLRQGMSLMWGISLPFYAVYLRSN